MSPGPLRRVVGLVGLAALVPTALLLTTGAITIIDAALRALATLVAVSLLGRVAGWVLAVLARDLDRAEPDGVTTGPVAPTGDAPADGRHGRGRTPRRRATDGPAGATDGDAGATPVTSARGTQGA